MKRITELPIFHDYPNANENLIQTLSEIDEAARDCGTTYCGGVGICGVNNTFWLRTNYSDLRYLWDGNTCFDQYQMGTSLILSGPTIKTQMNQCNSSKVVTWGDRHNSSQINYDPFCNGNIQVAVGLNLINRSIAFEAAVSNIKSNGFKLKYLLKQGGDYECTQIGGVSYGLFCDDTNIRVKQFGVDASEEYIWNPGSPQYTWHQNPGNSVGYAWEASCDGSQYTVSFGPYQPLPHDCTLGRTFTVTFQLSLNCPSCVDTGDPVIRIDVQDSTDWIILNESYLTFGAFQAQNTIQEFSLDFTPDPSKCGHQYEYRLLLTATCAGVSIKHYQTKLDNEFKIVNSTNYIDTTSFGIPLECDSSDTRAIGFISGYDYARSYQGVRTAYENRILGLESVNNSYVALKQAGFMNVSIIHFCYDENFIRYGNVTFTISQEIPNSDGISHFMARKWVRFLPTSLPCLNVNILYAFSGFDDDNTCSMALWTESVSGAGFNLVLGTWNNMIDDIAEADKSCVAAGSGVTVSYFAVCQVMFKFPYINLDTIVSL